MHHFSYGCGIGIFAPSGIGACQWLFSCHCIRRICKRPSGIIFSEAAITPEYGSVHHGKLHEIYEIYLIKMVGFLEIRLMGGCLIIYKYINKIKNRRSWFTDMYQAFLKHGRIRCSDTDVLIMLLYYSAVMITEVELWFWREEKQYFPIHKLS